MDDTLALVVRVFRALGPYAESCVLVGATAQLAWSGHRAALAVPSPRTRDADLAVAGRLDLIDGRTLREHLVAAGDLTVIEHAAGSTGGRRGVIRVVPAGADHTSPLYAEFVAPLAGSATTRTGAPRSPLAVQRDLAVAALRHVDLLLLDPLVLPLDSIPVPVVHPVAFVLQKLLIRGRLPARDARDAASIWHAAATWQDAELGAWLRDNGPCLGKNVLPNARATLDDAFATGASDGSLEAATYLAPTLGPHAPTPQLVATAVQQFAARAGLR
jgi:hypothetical protein